MTPATRACETGEAWRRRASALRVPRGAHS
jgi:hypothetical protein